jgi:hypothetical protein
MCDIVSIATVVALLRRHFTGHVTAVLQPWPWPLNLVCSVSVPLK